MRAAAHIRLAGSTALAASFFSPMSYDVAHGLADRVVYHGDEPVIVAAWLAPLPLALLAYRAKATFVRIAISFLTVLGAPVVFVIGGMLAHFDGHPAVGYYFAVAGVLLLAAALMIELVAPIWRYSRHRSASTRS